MKIEPKDKLFSRGDLVTALHFNNRPSIKVGVNCETIIVEMENGQMSFVPWFQVWNKGYLVSKWNAADVQGVEYLE